MSDLISRTGAIAHFDKVAEELDEQRGDDSWVGNAFKICLLGVVNDLAALPSAEPKTMDKTNANKIYNYLKERIGDIVDDMKEFDAWFERMVWHVKECNRLTAEPKTGWIPIKWHEITDEEREREGYPKDWVVRIDCEMPCDEQEILVQTKKGYIRWDVCYEDGEFSLDSGWDWIEDIVAWMPLPEPYREDGE